MGPQGPIGPKGDKGNTGAQGAQGPTEYHTMMANFALSGGGEVTWKGDLLTVRTRIIAIPVDKDLGSSGYFDIGPFEGLSIPAWHGVWYCPKKTQPNSYDSGALRVLAYSGSEVQPQEG